MDGGMGDWLLGFSGEEVQREVGMDGGIGDWYSGFSWGASEEMLW